MATASSIPDGKNYKCVAAIDFGTTYSGYAFSFPSDKHYMYLKDDWGTCTGIQKTFKTPTCVLTYSGECGDWIAFGYEAMEKFSEQKSSNADYCLFKDYKMHLHDTTPLTRNTYVTAVRGEKRKALDVFAMSLQFFPDKILRHIEKVAGGEISSDEVKWVITVPAIWSEASKMFMREAAYQARMIENRFSKNLVIALEPEAASLYCHGLDLDVLLPSKREKTSTKEGTKYLVLDCGGGTLDITAHELIKDDKVKELYKASGNAYGGMSVDKSFEEKVNDILGADVINQLKKDASSSWLYLITQFETKKRSIDPFNPAHTSTTLTFTPKLVKLIEKIHKKDIEEFFTEEWRELGITGGDNGITLTVEAMEAIFRPPVEAIVQFVEDLVKKPELKDITHMLVVGGFGDSAVLQDAIKRAFCERFQILVPSEAALCVLKGAVLFGHSPDSVIERIVSKTYGCSVCEKFNPEVHSPDKLIIVDGEKHANKIFMTIVTKEERADHMFEREFDLRPVGVNTQKVSTELFITDNDDPKYTDEPGMTKLAKVEIDLPGKGKDRKIGLKLIFGGTHVEVEFKDMRDTGAQVYEHIDFLVE